jgi:hypothetical protein
MSPESQNNGVKAILSIAGQWLHKHFITAIKLHTKIEEMLRHYFPFGLTRSYIGSTN